MSVGAEEGRKRSSFRLIVRCSALLAAVILVIGVLPWSWTSLVLPSLSPHVLICSAIAARSIGVATLVGLPVLAIVLVRRRWFCRYACPVGLMAEYVGRIRSSRTSRIKRLPSVGRWIVLVTLGGACLGYPLFLWMDPLAIFHGTFTLCRDPLSLAGQVSAVALAVILSVSLLLPGAWCLRICPLGATQDLLALPQRLRKGVRNLFPRQQQVQGEHLEAIREAPVAGPLSLWERVRVRVFGLAVAWPVSAALPIPPHPDPLPEGEGDFPDSLSGPKKVPGTFHCRRSFLSMGFGALCVGVGARWATAIAYFYPGGRRKPLRPPGSIDEERFPGLCIRCGNCIRACPTGIIRPDLGSQGIAGFLAPVVRFQDGYCREDCHLCTQVCPSGAITRLSLEEKQDTPMGVARVDFSICLLRENRECDICERVCPYEAIDIRWSEEEYLAIPQVDHEKCPGCGACEAACPGTNEWERRHADEPIPLRRAIEVHPCRRG